ncbi:hypothetical protein BS47DRAFT_1361063 [Hydnum rufescens UP504]|uniref:Uncharacterized protein n=1 Tax=Hydnum rufescens UP504 TaxID=1448309 RepID=A0A9P6B0C6_9AGAM|nr:hypothetical protein BS47DRAFT_1361063 [Hydnum rufescens UP504]
MMNPQQRSQKVTVIVKSEYEQLLLPKRQLYIIKHQSLPNDNPRPNSNQIHPQASSPVTYPNNYPLGMPQNQYANKSAEGSGNNLVCWFCDKVGTHNVGMKNCPDAQAMIRQNLIKYSIEGQLVKMDGSRLPRGIPGQGGFKQAIIDEIKRFGSDIPNTSHSGACSLVDDYGHSPFQGRAYAIEADYRVYPVAKQEKPNVRFTPMVEPPKEHKPIVEIKETAQPKAWKDNIPQEDIEMGFDAPEKKIPKQAPAF